MRSFNALSLSLAICVGSASPTHTNAQTRAGRSIMLPTQPGPDVRLHVRECGQGTPVLLVHGFGGSTYSWRHLMPVLSKGHRVIAVDLKGFGASPKPKDGAYSIQDQASLLRQFITKEDLRDLTIIGHSHGGGVALTTTLDTLQAADRRISALILIDSVGYPQDFPSFVKVLRTPIVRRLAPTLVPPRQQVRIVLELAYYKKERITEEQLTTYAGPISMPGGRYALLETARQIVPHDFTEFVGRYKSIDVPTLLIWGRHDKIVPLEIGKRLHKAIARSELVIIEDCGHIPHEEKPEEAIAAINRFIAQRRLPRK